MDLPEKYDRWLFNTGFHFGEWLIPSEPVGGFEICKASSFYVAPMFAYMSMVKMEEICNLLGENGEKYAEFAPIGGRIRTFFRSKKRGATIFLDFSIAVCYIPNQVSFR